MIQVKACALSHLDTQVRKGIFSFITSSPPSPSPSSHNNHSDHMNNNNMSGGGDGDIGGENVLGFVMGYEIAGIVVSVGRHLERHVKKFKVGDHVAAIIPLDHHLAHHLQYGSGGGSGGMHPTQPPPPPPPQSSSSSSFTHNSCSSSSDGDEREQEHEENDRVKGEHGKNDKNDKNDKSDDETEDDDGDDDNLSFYNKVGVMKSGPPDRLKQITTTTTTKKKKKKKKRRKNRDDSYVISPKNKDSDDDNDFDDEFDDSTLSQLLRSAQCSPYLECGGGYSDYVTLDAHFVVKIPEEMAFDRAASCLLSGLRAYSCLFDHCRHLQKGCSLFVDHGANAMQSFVVQLALSMQINVWTTVSSDIELNVLSDMTSSSLSSSTSGAVPSSSSSSSLSSLSLVDDATTSTASSRSTALLNSSDMSSGGGVGGSLEAAQSRSSGSLTIIDTRLVKNIEKYMMQETGGMGVDAVLMDDTTNENGSSLLDSFIAILGLNGTLVMPHCPFGPPRTAPSTRTTVPTSSSLARIDEGPDNRNSRGHTDEDEYFTTPISQLNMAHYKNLYMKNGRVAFLFEQSYVLSCAQQGRYLHMLTQVIQQVNSGKIDVKIAHTLPLEKVREAHRRVEQYPNIGKIVLKL